MEKKGLDTRTTILEAALQLFFTQGYKEVSYQDLITKTGLSKGAIYHHFKNKEEILVSVFEYFLASSQQPDQVNIQVELPGYQQFIELYINIKKEQFEAFKKLLNTDNLKLNKLLFFLEAINEKDALKQFIADIMKQEQLFLETCFISLHKNGKLPKGKQPELLARNLYFMLQGAEIMIFFGVNNIEEEVFLEAYTNTLKDFFAMI